MKYNVACFPDGIFYLVENNPPKLEMGETVWVSCPVYGNRKAIITELFSSGNVGVGMTATRSDGTIVQRSKAYRRVAIYKILMRFEEKPPAILCYRNLSEEEVQQILNPQPPIPQGILQIADILRGCGEYWKDDTGAEHIDDVNVLDAATKIFESLQEQKINFITKEIIKHEEETKQPENVW
jgi:hypothetical protein